MIDSFIACSLVHSWQIGYESEHIEGVTDVVVLDSPAAAGQRLEGMLLTSETVGGTSRFPTTPMKGTDGSNNPMNDANMESLRGDLVKFTRSYPCVS